MEILTDKNINDLFSNLCCARCKNDFTKNSFEIVEKKGDLLVCKLVCEKCGKDYGEVVLNFNRKSKAHSPLNIIDGPEPISYDDVIDAHKYIKKYL